MRLPLSVMIAWRNIFRHKGKSLVIGSILFLGSLIMTVGNGVISGMDRGVERNIVNGFLGNAVIISDKQKSDNILFEMMGAAIEPLPNFAQIRPVLARLPYVERFLPAGKNMGMVLSGDENAAPSFLYLIGVDFAAYEKMFPGNMRPVEGRFLKSGEPGILLTKQLRDEHIYPSLNQWPVPVGGSVVEANLSKEARENRPELKTTDNLVIMGSNLDNSSTDIRFPIRGIVKYRALDTMFGHFALTDMESYRACLGYFSASSQSVPVAGETQKILNLDNSNLDALFETGNLFVDNPRNPVRPVLSRKPAPAPSGSPNLEDGIYNLIFVKFKDSRPAGSALKDLNRELKLAKTGSRAVSWKKAAGPIGSMTTLIKGSLLLFVTFLFVVAVIIIVNTLTMAAMERTPEIGMMRAIGARQGFIRAMFFGETGMLALVFGGAGLLLGALIVNVIPWLHITSANDFVQLLYGGDTFHPMLKPGDLVLTVLELVFVTVAAALYPARVASQIKPLDAVARD